MAEKKDAIIGGLIETVRMALQLYLTLAAQAGLTAEQVEEMARLERIKFYENNPDLIPKPPED